MSKKKRPKRPIVHGKEIPEGAVLANYSKQMSDYPVGFYEDIHFECAGCGARSTWTAIQQKKYFEDQGGNKHNTPKWCTPCHRKRMAEKHVKKV
jgi:hypothetical protein